MSNHVVIEQGASGTEVQDNAPYAGCSLVLLRDGADGPPLFMLPGGGGGKVTDFSALVNSIQYEKAIFGIRLEDLERDLAAPQKPVEELAKICFNVIASRQSRGPYFFLGHSLGGLIMMEIARQMWERGERVAFLGFLDTYPPRRHWPFKTWIRMVTRRSKHHARVLMNVPVRDAIIEMARLFGALMDHFRLRHGEVPHKWISSQTTISPSLGSANEVVGNWSSYRPRYYDNKITFFTAEHPTDTPDDPLSVWRKFSKSIEIHVVPGDHVDMLSKRPEMLAKVISFCLDDVANSAPPIFE
jgi:thioesterase domain-containing protein